jgi:predicted ATPase/DNA-binding SARP family transcriptional activator/Tfp pilus assembly protein PilF
VDFRILGSLEVLDGDRRLALGGMKQRALLALLLLHANEVVSSDRLIAALWGEQRVEDASRPLQVAVSRLRRTLEPDRPSGQPSELLIARPPGYALLLDRGQLDLERFEDGAASGREALAEGDPARAADALGGALALWRGPPLADFDYESFAQAEIGRLEELRISALEDRIAADLELGRHANLVGELRELAERHPLRERVRGQLMLALYRSGRQAEALEAFRDARGSLVAELGIEPEPALQRLHASILGQEASLDAPKHALAPKPGPPVAPFKLPLLRTGTVGRAQDVARVRELLGSTRLLTLVGAGGIGKTRLAVEVARAARADYADGVCFASLLSTEAPDLVATTVAAGLAVVLLADEPALDGLVRLIDDKQMLVVLDNFEHVLAAADVVSELLEACEGLRILITSREPLRLSGEQLFVVGPLALPAPEQRPDPLTILRSAAVRLFVERCRARDVGFVLDDANAASVAEICTRLNGMPLAIELAAAHATLLAPEEMIGRLDDALTVLVGGPRDAPARQQTLRATLDWSHALLDPHEQRAFAGLAVFSGGCPFSGGCTLEAAETVLGIDLSAVEALLAKSLLVTHTHNAGERRVRMLEPVRAYALERFMERRDAEDLRRRHCEYYVALAERSEPALRGPDQLIWLHRLGADHANLRAAVLWSLRAGRPELGLRLASALGIHAGGLHSEIPGWLEATLGAASDVEPALRAKALLASGLIIGGGPASVEQLHQALSVFRANSDAHGAAQALIALSIDTDQAGERDLAAQLAGEALELARTTEDDWLIASALGAQVLGSPESFRQTRHFGEQGLAMVRRSGDRIQLSIALGNFGFAALAAGDYDAAAPALEEALAIAEEVEDARLLPFSTVNRGLLHVLQGEDQLAARDFARTLALCRESGQPLPVAEALTGLAAIAVRQGEMELVPRLSGAADAHRLFGAVGEPELHLRRQLIDPARARCDDDDWAREWAAGNSLSFSQAITLGIDAVAVRSRAT